MEHAIDSDADKSHPRGALEEWQSSDCGWVRELLRCTGGLSFWPTVWALEWFGRGHLGSGDWHLYSIQFELGHVLQQHGGLGRWARVH